MSSREIAEQFVGARLRAAALRAFPNTIPSTLDDAYATQDWAIGLWPDRLVGWKVGRIAPPWLEQLQEDRLIGPIFEQGVRRVAAAELVEFPAFEGGFAAVEAEFVFRLRANAPPDKATWTVDEAAQLACALHVGIETAGSPLASINDLGPLAVVCDFGNNAGLLLGPEVMDWRQRHFEALTCETLIQDRTVGHGGALSVPGGPLAALAFALQRCAKRGRLLLSGDLVSTGAATGIHPIRSGQHARVRFDGIAELRCRAVPAAPLCPTPS
jgi:2-keto-4-pentenoate hydratase